MINKIKNGIYRLLFQQSDIRMDIIDSWSSNNAVCMKGWIISEKGPIDKVEVEVDGVRVPIKSWYSRADIHAQYPQSGDDDKCGFIVQIPRTSIHKATFKVTSDSKQRSHRIAFRGHAPQRPTEYPDGEGIFDDFVRRVNEEHLHVLEIGSRIVSPGSKSQRDLFPGAASYTGFDYYPDANTDVVGDAHRLSTYFDGKKFDAVFSVVVFEHLAMPWVVAMEINKVLRIGGLSCHMTPFAWPAHERPWDFYRTSDEGLKVLFSKSMGFDTINAGMYNPLRMVMDEPQEGYEDFTFAAGFGSSAILSRKVAEIDSSRFKWDVSLTETVGEDSHYPEKTD